MRWTNQVVSQFDIAPSAPAKVAGAKVTFDRIAAEWHEAQAELSEATELSRVDTARATSEAAAARLAGKKVPRDPAEVAFDHEQKIASCQAKVESLTLALDQAGNQLADEIVLGEDEWLKALDKTEATAIKRLEKALSNARVALQDLSGARTAPQWLRKFNLSQAKAGLQGQYVMTPVTIDAAMSKTDLRLDSHTSALALVGLLAKAAEPVGKPEGPRQLKTERPAPYEGESQFDKQGAIVRKVRSGS